MGDDPYDFDIAIPTGKTANTNTYGASHRRGKGSDDDDDDDHSDSGSDISMSSSDNDSDRSPKKKTNVPGRKPAPTASATSRGGGIAASIKGGGGGSGPTSALDKAKSFLSKYSTKTTAATTANTPKTRSQRLEMSLDDDDFSLDSSGEEVKTSKKKAAPASQQNVKKTATVRGASPRSAESDDDDDRDDVKSRRQQPITDSNSDEENDYRKLAAPVVPTTKPLASGATSDSDDDARPSSDKEDSGAYDDEEEQPPPRATPSSQMGLAKPAASTAPWSTYSSMGAATKKQQVTTNDDDDDDVESIASEDLSENDQDKPTGSSSQRHLSTATTSSTAPQWQASYGKERQISAMSESEAYEEDNFEDDSVVQAAVVPPGTFVTPAEPSHRLRDEKSNFDYSLDFAEDTEPPATHSLPVMKLQDADDVHEHERSASSSSSESDRESYVEQSEEDESHNSKERDSSENEPVREHPSVVGVSPSPIQEESQRDYSQDNRFESESMGVVTSPSIARTAPPAAHYSAPADGAASLNHATVMPLVPPVPPQATRLEPPPPTAPTWHSSSTPPRARVVIVREYQQDKSQVETRDAETQCTGNHAGIQTDLVPDGMHSSTTSNRRRPSNEPTDDTNAKEDPGCSMSPPPPAPPAPPAPPPQLPRRQEPALPGPPPSIYATYGMYDPLELPAATSMSLYKQQLLSLQQQIRHKKLETERLFRDRVTSRYSSLRGTERFLEAHRPSRLPLWQALLRVDPSLDEDKAKQIARLATDGAA